MVDMKKMAFVFLIVLAIPVLGFSQQKATGQKKQKVATKTIEKKAVKATETPRLLAPPVKYDASCNLYFPYYSTCYDASRGYVSAHANDEKFIPVVTPVLKKANLGRLRIKLLKGLTLDMNPQLNFPHQVKQYPADPNGNVMVAAPIPGNPAGN